MQDFTRFRYIANRISTRRKLIQGPFIMILHRHFIAKFIIAIDFNVCKTYSMMTYCQLTDYQIYLYIYHWYFTDSLHV